MRNGKIKFKINNNEDIPEKCCYPCVYIKNLLA